MIKESKFNKIYNRIISECNIWNVVTEYVNDESSTSINKNFF